eukprot:TRINITY_DN24668_c0_g1_i1.p1 TRINITY_DN24668_c0_g1~~TRINITY_DN24668_c0_g1_i1.p1  ORF type:complete len:513 (+),score=127.50 TRINITY_DN24668_c0_g1_i1:79-1539(+)
MLRSLVGSEMCIRDSINAEYGEAREIHQSIFMEQPVRSSPRLRARIAANAERTDDNGRMLRSSPRSKSAPRREMTSREPDKAEGRSNEGINVEHKSDETQGSGKFAKMVRRTAYGLLMIGSFATILWTGHLAVVTLVILLQTLVFSELISIRHVKKMDDEIPLFRTLHWVGYFISMFFTYGKSMMLYFNLDAMARYHFYLVFSMYVPFFVAFVVSCAFSGEGKSKESKRQLLQYMFSQISWTLLILFVVVFQMRFVMYIITEGLFWFLLPTSLVILNDTAAYFVGFMCGKKFISRPLTVLSPNKTWEGFLGGMLFTLIFGYFVAGWMAQYHHLICPHRHYTDVVESCKPNSVFEVSTYTVWPEVVSAFDVVGVVVPASFEMLPVKLHALLLAFFASIFAPFGGFFASAMKRAYKVSDFGSLIPGHGGVMDRMDCQLIMLFCTHVHYRTFVREVALSADVVWPTLLKLTAADQHEVLQRLTSHLGGF